MRPCARLSLAALAASAFLLPTPSAGAFNSTLESLKSVSFEADGSSRHLAVAAKWLPWPSATVRNLEVVHNLCDPEWIEALEIAAREWTARSSTVNLRVKAANCIWENNADLNYSKDSKIRVVYGTCNEGCCGKADVSYSYRTLHGELDVTDYKALVRFDRTCFGGDDYQHNAVGRQYLACHELGHALGLAHNNDQYSCMNVFHPNNYLPGPDDIRVLDNVLYAYGGYNPIFNAKHLETAPRPPTPRPYTPPSTVSVVKDGNCDKGECGPCQGDCDSDKECRDGLKCFFRDGNDLIPPGCTGRAAKSVDYCYYPFAPAPPPTLRSPTPKPPKYNKPRLPATRSPTARYSLPQRVGRNENPGV